MSRPAYACFPSSPRCKDLLVENLRFFAVLPTPVSFDALLVGFPEDLGYESWYQQTIPVVSGLPQGGKRIILPSLVLCQYSICVAETSLLLFKTSKQCIPVTNCVA